MAIQVRKIVSICVSEPKKFHRELLHQPQLPAHRRDCVCRRMWGTSSLWYKKNRMIYKLVGKIPITPLGDWEKLLWYVVWRPNSDQLHVCGGRAVHILKRRSEGLELVKSMVIAIHNKSIRKIAFSADGCLMAVASFDSKVSVWKINKQDEWINISMIEGHQNEVKGVDFQPHPRNPNQTIIATCGRDHTVWIWTHDPQEDLPKEDGSIEFCCSAFLSNHTQGEWGSKRRRFLRRCQGCLFPPVANDADFWVI